MFKKLSQDARTVVLSVVAASVVAGPSAAAAAYVANADKVDNKHAVSSGATVTNRKGKLVATNATTGLLPNNIIAKALDAEKLDGLDSTQFLRSGGKAADADSVDGLDSGQLLSLQNYEFKYSAVSSAFGSGSSRSVQAFCSEGTNPLGGGVTVVSGDPRNSQVTQSFPGNWVWWRGWQAEVFHRGAVPGDLTVQAVVTCAK